MAFLKKFKKEGPRELAFRASVDEYVRSPPGSPTEGRALASLIEALAGKQLSTEAAMSILKGHIKQGCEYDIPHRARALFLLGQLSADVRAGPDIMAVASSQRWRDRLKQCAVESYSPPLQDAVVQLVFGWASRFRSTDIGVAMQQLLFELESEGIIVEGTWKLDGARPQVIALMGVADASRPPAHANGDGATSATSPRAAAPPPPPPRAASLAPGGGSGVQASPYSEGSLLTQADTMSDDAVALTCASDALQEALDRGAGGASGGSGAEVAELRQRGGELAARCALHLARLQEALSRASLSDVAMAQLIELADALNTQQERWQQLAQRRPSAAASPAATSPAGAASPPTQATSPAAAAPVPDLLNLDDDDLAPPPPAAAAAKSASADPFAAFATPSPAPPPAAPAPAAAPFMGGFAAAAANAAVAAGFAAAPPLAAPPPAPQAYAPPPAPVPSPAPPSAQSPFTPSNPFAAAPPAPPPAFPTTTPPPAQPPAPPPPPPQVTAGIAVDDPFAELVASKLPAKPAPPPPMAASATAPVGGAATAAPPPPVAHLTDALAGFGLQQQQQQHPQLAPHALSAPIPPAAAAGAASPAPGGYGLAPTMPSVPLSSNNPFAAAAAPAPVAYGAAAINPFAAAAPPQQQGAYGGYGAQPQVAASAWGAAPQAFGGGWGAPAGGAYGAPVPPPQQQQYGAPLPQQQAYGAPPPTYGGYPGQQPQQPQQQQQGPSWVNFG